MTHLYNAQAIGTKNQDFWIDCIIHKSSEFQISCFLFVIGILLILEINLPLKQLTLPFGSISHE